MPLYRITAPNGLTYQIEGPPGASDAEVADAVLRQNPEAGQPPAPPKESTIGGELIRGAKQLASSTRTGIESLLDPNKAATAGMARSEAISKAAGTGPSLDAIQKAYAENGLLSAAGETVSQVPKLLAGQAANIGTNIAGAKLGSTLGSAFGTRGRIVGGALGSAASMFPQYVGSNVERQASEQQDEGKPANVNLKSATAAAAGQSALEGLGTAVVFGKRFVKGVLGISEDAALRSTQAQAELVKAAERSLAASAGRGAVRGMAEIPVEVGQQIIERAQAGLDLTSDDAMREYGEAAYQAGLIGGTIGGASTALGRGSAREELARQQAAQAAQQTPPATSPKPEPEPEPEVVPGAKLPEEAPPATQGTLFAPKEMGKKVRAPETGAAPETPTYTELTERRDELRAQEQTPEVRAELDEIAKRLAPKSEEQMGLGLDYERDYTDLFKERDRLREQPQTPEVKARIDELSEQLKSYDEADIGRRQAEKALREERLAKEAEQKAADEAAASKFPGLAGPTTAPITQADIDAIGLPLRTSKQWLTDNVIGKTVEEIKALVQRDPKLISGKGARAEVLKALIAPQPTPFTEKPNVQTTPKTDQPQGELDLGGGESGVGVSGKPAGADVVQPGAGVSTTPSAPATPDGLGLAPTGQPAGKRTNAKGTQPPAVTAFPNVDAIPSFPMGPASIKPSVVARDKPVYHETNTTGLDDLLRHDGQYEYSGAFVADNPDLALGQGANTGVFIEFRPNSVSGKVNPKIGTSPETGQEHRSDVIAPKAISAITVKAGSKFAPRPVTRRILTAEFDKTTLPDGSTRYVRKGTTPSGALPVTWTPNAPATTPAAPSAPAAPKATAKPKAVAKPAVAPAAPKTTPTPAPTVAAETVDEEAERKREAEEFKRQMEETERKAKEARAKAAAAAATASTPPKPTAAHPKWATSAAMKAKGVVVYSSGDNALIKHVGRDGKITYSGTNATTAPHLSADVSLLTPGITKRFSFQEIAEFQKARREDIKAEDDLAKKYPDGPFTNAKSNVVVGDNVNPRYANYLRELMAELGLGNIRTFLFTKKDVENFPPRYHLHGAYARPYELLAEDDTTFGATTQFGPTRGDFILYLQDGLDTDLAIEIIAHELGHMIQHIAFNKASAQEKQAVMDEYDAWLAENKTKKMADVIPALRNRRNTEFMESQSIPDVIAENLPVKRQQYWLGFSEWFADNVSRWATTADKPLTVAEKFFSKVAQMMRDLVAVVTGRKFPPARSVAEFLENMGPGSADAWIQSTTPGGAPSVSPNTIGFDETPAFKKWFGDSKVVDADGNPLVVYHGTLSNFDTFKLSPEGALGAGIYTTPSAEFAGTYADTNNLSRPDAGIHEVSGQQILPVYVSMQNPLVLDNERGDPMVAALVKLGMDRNKAETLVEKAYDEHGYIRKQVMTRAIAQGYDGIMQYKNGELSEIVAFKPNQIKSAIGNQGTFSTENPKIQYAVSFSTKQLVDSLGDLDQTQQRGVTNLVNGVQSNTEVGYVTKFRTQTADIAATIEERLRKKFDGAVRNSLGELNPMGLYRQAQDYAKMLLEYFQTGMLYKDPVDGLWKAGTGENVRAPADVYKLIDQYGEKNGYTREEATKIASRVLEGVRLNQMRASNQTGMTNFRLHLTDAQIDQFMAEYNADPDLQEMSKLMDEARIEMVNNLVKVGRLTKEEGDEWKSVVGYVPFDRIEDFATNFSKVKKISGKGIAQLGKLPELIGSEVRPVGNVFDNYINTLGWMVGQTLKTDATTTTLRSLEDIGHAKYIGLDSLGRPNAVGAYIKGEMHYWELPSKYDLMAFKDLNPPKAGWLRAMGAFSNLLRKLVTVLPPFALKQVTDDVQRAILTSGVRNPGALIWMSLTNFPKLALAELRGIQHPVVREFGKLGLTGEYDFEAGKPASSLLKDLGYKERTVLGSSKLGALIHRLDGITRASDLAVRKAIYDQTLRETKDTLLAQTRAREFINFRRRGASDFVGAMVTTIPFFNAYIQGMDVLYRAASGKDSSASVDRAQARRLFWSRASIVMMLSSLYALGKYDDEDEDYEEMDLRTRDSNWILPGGYKIPVPGELGAIFKVIPERVVEYMKRQGTPEEQTAWEATRTTLAYMFEQYLGRAMPIPQAIKPVMEAWANKSFLTGRDLEGYHHKAMDPSMRTNEQTSELAKAIAKFSRDEIGVEVSPIMIDNSLRGYFGSTAAMFTMVTDSLLNPTRIDRPLHKYALLSNYMYDPVGTRRMTEFYDEREKVGKANTTLRELMKTDVDRAEKYANEHQSELALESAINSTLEHLERTRAYRKFLNSPDGANEMSREEREEALNEIKKTEMEYVKWVREAQTELRKVQ